jgi:hypothetical protein
MAEETSPIATISSLDHSKTERLSLLALMPLGRSNPLASPTKAFLAAGDAEV